MYGENGIIFIYGATIMKSNSIFPNHLEFETLKEYSYNVNKLKNKGKIINSKSGWYVCS